MTALSFSTQSRQGVKGALGTPYVVLPALAGIPVVGTPDSRIDIKNFTSYASLRVCIKRPLL